jgi:outer membrane protein
VTASAEEGGRVPSAAIDSALLADLVRDAPIVRQAEADLLVARAGVRTAKAGYLPTISSSYSFSTNASSRGFVPGNIFLIGTGDNPNSRRLNFSLSYPIFNQLQRETTRISADIAEQNAEASLRDARLAVQQTLTQALGSLRLAEERIRIQEASVIAGEEDLRVQNERYQLGAATLLDVLTSQSTLNQARVALIQARYDVRIARAQLEALVGREL